MKDLHQGTSPERWGGYPALHYSDLGTSGSSIVFLPGVGGTIRYWEPRLAPLARDHGIRLVDLLGFGRSPKPWVVRYTVERHLEALHGVLHDYSAPDRFTLVGHSFGAILAVAYAAEWPERVDRLVLLSLPHFGGQERALRHFRQSGTPERWLLTNVTLAAITCIVTRRVVRRVLPGLLPELPLEVVQDLVQHTWRSSTSTVWEGVYRHDVARDADRLPPDLPVLLLHGDRDETAPLAGMTRLLATHPHWAVRVLPGIGHHPFLHRTNLCIQAIGEFTKI